MKRRSFLLAAPAVITAGPSLAARSKFKIYNGPEITQVTIKKGLRKMYLLSGKDVLLDYKVSLGFNPIGHKQVRGDGRTPEGLYRIDRQNENSRYHLSLGLSYPNRADWEYARSIGQHPGGDIFIHGEPVTARERRARPDWTAGCVAVKDRQMEDIFAMVNVGTLVHITS
ncbi:MAG: L,D-transpeptidase family protein [Pseudomonadota bacterium]